MIMATYDDRPCYKQLYVYIKAYLSATNAVVTKHLSRIDMIL